MRIDGPSGTSRYEPAPGPDPRLASRLPVPPGASQPVPDDPEITRLHGKYAPQAAAADPVDQQAVERARQAIQAGTLDTPEAIGRAAQAILNLGL